MKKKRKVVIASTNPVKLQAAELGFLQMFPGEEFEYKEAKAQSGVPDQPFSDAETLRGAENRVTHAKILSPGADFYVAFEGGVEDRDGEMTESAWAVVESKGRIGKGRTATFVVPPEVARLVRGGKELGDASDIVFGKTNSKQKMGTIGLLTDDVIDRVEFYRHAMVIALIPFKKPKLYKG